MDMGFLIFLSAVVLVTVDIVPDFNLSFGTYQLSREMLASSAKNLFHLCLIMMGGILLILPSLTRSLIRRLILFLPEIIPFSSKGVKHKIGERFMQPLANLISLFAAGFSLLKRLIKITQCLILTLLIWGGTALSFYVMAKGCPEVELSYLESIALMVIICLFIALPSAPGYWGLWEAGGVFGLSLFGVPAKIAAGYTLTNHFIQLLQVIVIGLISAMVTSVNIFQVSKTFPQSDKTLGE